MTKVTTTTSDKEENMPVFGVSQDRIIPLTMAHNYPIVNGEIRIKLIHAFGATTITIPVEDLEK